MKRKIYQDLLNWKNSSNRMPLILQGARQVGKTYIATIFGNNEYANVAYFNFEQDETLMDFFSILDPSRIIKFLSSYAKKEIMKNNTLIIFDEIQYCPRALTSLKYFQEEANEYHIIATGSLLGIALNRGSYSFPVGKVQFMKMYPMDFEEFLLAQEENYIPLIEEIKTCYLENKPIPRPFHLEALDLYKEFLYIGGMPGVVQQFIENKNMEYAKIIQEEIIEAYLKDMSKYNKPSEVIKVQLVYKNITSQLAKANHKFKYSLIKPSSRARDFEDALEWLTMSQIAQKLYKLEQIKLPLDAFQSLVDFKLYMNDVGLCCASHKVQYGEIILNEDSFEFKGGLTENYVFNQLIINGLFPYYWTSKSDAEIDFITRIGKDIIPIEVKSSDNTKSKSLNIYMNKFNPTYAIRISTKNFGFKNNIKSVPLYACFCIK